MRGADLTAVISWLEAGCDPAEAAKELRSYQEVLSSQSLSLSEAREEIERLRAALLHHETGERITRKDLNNAHRKGAEEGRIAAHLIDGISAERQRDEALEALRALVDCHAVFTGEPGHDAEVWARADEKARLVLENGPAGLADATNDPASPDLSSLRKRAEVVAWRYRYIRSGVPAPWMVTTRVEDTMGLDVESEPLFTAALVSGSREEQ